MMSEIYDSRKRVTSPEHNRSKRRVNEQLIKIKEELLFDENRDETPETELSFEYTQLIRPQQFFAGIDGKLDGLKRDYNIKELLHICHKDYSKLLDYRERLAKRAQSIPNCPQTRLVNRHNSATGTREEKCATDCFVLYAYNHGNARISTTQPYPT